MIDSYKIQLVSMLCLVVNLLFNPFLRAEEPDYFPLAVGNEWRYASRISAPLILTRILKITGTRKINGHTYYILEKCDETWRRTTLTSVQLYRKDERNQVLLKAGDRDIVWLKLNAKEDESWDFSLPTWERLLFSIELVFQNDLDNGNSVPENLRKEFRNNGILLPPNVTIEKEGEQWLIIYMGDELMYPITMYRITKGEEKLDVYSILEYRVTVKKNVELDTFAGRFIHCMIFWFHHKTALESDYAVMLAPNIGVVRYNLPGIGGSSLILSDYTLLSSVSVNPLGKLITIFGKLKRLR